MKLPRWAGTMAVVISILLWAGCGDTFRPVVNPVLPPGPSPQSSTFALVLNQNPSAAGAAAEINISGDSNFWNQPVSTTPVHAALEGLEAFVANQDSDSVTVFAIGASQPLVNTLLLGVNSKPTFVLPLITAVSAAGGPMVAATVDLSTEGINYKVGDQLTVVQTGASGGVVRVLTIGTTGNVTSVDIIALGTGYNVANGLATTTTGTGTGAQVDITAVGGTGKVYVANFGNNTVSVMDPTVFPLQVTATISLSGSGPMAMTASTDGSQIFVVNRGSNNVSVISAASNTEVKTIPVGTRPVAAATNTAIGSLGLVYVYAGDGTISVISPQTDPTTDAVVATASATPLAGASPCLATQPHAPCAPMAFEARSQRLYVADGTATVSIFNAATNTPALLASLAGFQPTMVAPLPDGSRAYVVNTGLSTSSSCGAVGASVVSVINTSNNQVSKCVKVGTSPVAIAASIDSSRVFVPHQGPGIDVATGNLTFPVGTTDITTSNDTVMIDLAAPPVDPNCFDVSCARITPVFAVTSR